MPAGTGDPNPFDRGDVGPPSPTKPSYASLEQAAHWYATLRDTAATEEDRLAWQDWLMQSPENERAWHHIESVSSKFAPLRGHGPIGGAAAAAGVEAARHAPGLSRRGLLGGVTGMLGLGVGSWLAWRHTALPELVAAIRADQRTGIGERRNIVLADGTRIWLNTSTSLNVDYQSRLRRLVLLTGEILIETALDSQQRPFYVETSFGRLQALGTRFTVRQTGPQSRLDVFDGAVEIRTASGRIQRVHAGQAALFDATTIAPLESADSGREAWSRGRIQAEAMPLGKLLEELNRYRHGHISVAAEVADIKVMGVYPADDPDRALAMLEQNLPIRVRRTLPWWIGVEAR